jgi:hypothetical protein
VDEMTLRDVLDIHEYWRAYPPLEEFVPAYCGWKSDKQPTTKRNAKSELAKMKAEMAMLTGKRR